jgi:UDP-2-acetamido-2,6-beta-L-arabino-hexul-4-ose reductase
MVKIGITGQGRFCGDALPGRACFSEEFERINFKEYFANSNKLNEFVAQCDIIVHLAMNHIMTLSYL